MKSLRKVKPLERVAAIVLALITTLGNGNTKLAYALDPCAEGSYEIPVAEDDIATLRIEYIEPDVAKGKLKFKVSAVDKTSNKPHAIKAGEWNNITGVMDMNDLAPVECGSLTTISS